MLMSCAAYPDCLG